MATSYQKTGKGGQRNEVHDALEAFVQEGARKMLAAALEEEVNGFLERTRYRRGKVFRGYRNGYHPLREITVGLGPVEVRVPRVAHVPPEVGLGPVEVRVPRVAHVPPEVAPQGFQSQIVKRYQRASETTRRLFARLYLEGLATGDFEPVFRELVGETTALSPNAIVRLKERWEKEYEAWQRRPLWGHRYAYTWEDGIYLGAGLEKEKMALLCVVGAREDGEKELLGMEPGYREGKESWAEMLRGLRNRGLETPMVATGDGGLGLWAALDEVYPTTEHQRCWNHRVMNVQARLPQRYQAEVRRRLREMSEAQTQKECEELRDRYVAELSDRGQRAAAETMHRDWEDFVTFYHYPKEHWIHLRTTNPIESIFSGVRLRTDATRRMRRRDNALYLVFKIVQRLSQNWRTLNGGANLMTLVLEGRKFKDGVLQPERVPELVETRS